MIESSRFFVSFTSFQRASCLGNILLVTKTGRTGYAAFTGASIIVDAKLQRFLLIAQAFQGIFFVRCSLRKKSLWHVSISSWVRLRKFNFSFYTKLLANRWNARV
jgi:hypothetical protein